MKRSLKWSWLALVAVTLLAAVGMSLHSQAQTQDQIPGPARSRSDEMLDRWNDIGNKLVAMAKDFPEDKYDFKVQKDQRTFADNLLHPSPSKEFSFAVARIENAVAEKHEHVSGLHAEMELIVFGFVEQAQWQAGGFDHFERTRDA